MAGLVRAPTMREKGMRRDAMRRMWRILLINLLYLLVANSFHDLEGAFIRSTVECAQPLPDPWTDKCATGSYYHNHTTCIAEPVDSPHWSYSATCASKSYVLNTAVRLHAEIKQVSNIAVIFATIMLGPLVDSVGRRPFILLALFGGCVRCFLYMAGASIVGQNRLQFAILIFANVISYGTNILVTATNAMVADLSRPDLQGRSAGYAMVHLVHNLAHLAGIGLGYFVLKLHLTNYTFVMGVCAFWYLVVFLVASAVLKETMDEDRTEDVEIEEEDDIDLQFEPLQDDEQWTGEEGDSDDGSYCSLVGICAQSASQTCSTFFVFWREPFLRQFIGLSALAAVATPAGQMGHLVLMNQLDYSPETASLLGVLKPCFGAAGAVLAASLSYAIGSYATLGLALVLEFVALTLIGCVGPFIGFGELLLWTGVVLSGIGGGIIQTVSSSLMSVRVADELQGRLFAFHQIVSLMGSTLGHMIFEEYLYDADWDGWRSGVAFFTGAAINFFNFMWLIEIYVCVVRRNNKRARLMALAEDKVAAFGETIESDREFNRIAQDIMGQAYKNSFLLSPSRI